MEMKQEQELIRQRLDRELGELHFTHVEDVLERTHPYTWQARLRALWNKEIELPLFPLGVGIALILTVVMITQLEDDHRGANPTYLKHRQLIEAGGNTYWKDDYEKAVNEGEGNP